MHEKLALGILRSHFKREVLIPSLKEQGKLKPIKAPSNKAIDRSNVPTQIDATGMFEKTYTTKELLAEEHETIALMKDGFNTQKSIYTKVEIKQQLKKTTLNKGQKSAILLILNTKDRVVGVQGHAGTGKTFMQAVARKLLAKRGYEAIGLASSSAAASVLQKDTKIKSQTVHKFLKQYKGVLEGRGTIQGRKDMQQHFSNKVLVLDEASLASTNQVNALLKISKELKVRLILLGDALLKISKELKVRLILLGDAKQLGAVEAGKPFTQLPKSGMKIVNMDMIVRQTDKSLKDAVYSTIANVDSQNGIYIRKAIEKIGNNFHEVKIESAKEDEPPTREEIIDGLTEDAATMWLKQTKQIRKNTLIITPSHDIRNITNRIIVEGLRKEKIITGKQADFITLRSKNLTDAEKTRSDKYGYAHDDNPADQVLFYKNYKSIGVKAGHYYAVEQTNGYNKVKLRGITDQKFTCWFDPSKLGGNKKGALEVFEIENKVGLQKGALIRWTKNSFKHSIIKNSEEAKILKVTDKHVEVKLKCGTKKMISKDDNVFKHVTFAYCATVHAAQGTTAKYVIGVIESAHNHLTNQRLFYVEISRAKEKICILSDSLKTLMANLSKITGAKLSSLEHQNKLQLDKAGGSLAYLTNNTALDSRWSKTMQDTVKQFGENTYLSWFSRLEFDSKRKNTVHLKTTLPLAKEFIETQYDKKFKEIVSKHFKNTTKIEIAVDKGAKSTDTNIAPLANMKQKELDKMELTI